MVLSFNNCVTLVIQVELQKITTHISVESIMDYSNIPALSRTVTSKTKCRMLLFIVKINNLRALLPCMVTHISITIDSNIHIENE